MRQQHWSWPLQQGLHIGALHVPSQQGAYPQQPFIFFSLPQSQHHSNLQQQILLAPEQPKHSQPWTQRKPWFRQQKPFHRITFSSLILGLQPPASSAIFQEVMFCTHTMKSANDREVIKRSGFASTLRSPLSRRGELRRTDETSGEMHCHHHRSFGYLSEASPSRSITSYLTLVRAAAAVSSTSLLRDEPATRVVGARSPP